MINLGHMRQTGEASRGKTPYVINFHDKTHATQNSTLVGLSNQGKTSYVINFTDKKQMYFSEGINKQGQHTANTKQCPAFGAVAEGNSQAHNLAGNNAATAGPSNPGGSRCRNSSDAAHIAGSCQHNPGLLSVPSCSYTNYRTTFCPGNNR